MAQNGNGNHGLHLREGGWVYAALTLIGWEHWRLMGGEANLCKVFWSIILGVPFVGIARGLNWTFAVGTRRERVLKYAGVVVLIALLAGAIRGEQAALWVIALAIGAVVAVGVVLGLAVAIVKGVRAIDEHGLPSAIGESIHHRSAPIGELFRVLGHKLRAAKMRVCPPIYFS